MLGPLVRVPASNATRKLHQVLESPIRLFQNVFAIILHDDLIVLDLVINMGQFVIGVLPIHLQI